MERLIVCSFKFFDTKKRRYVQTDKLATRAAIARMGWREIHGSARFVAADAVDEVGIVRGAAIFEEELETAH